MEQYSLRDIIDFEKVGRHNIKIFLNYLFERDSYVDYLMKEFPSLDDCTKIQHAEDLSQYESWQSYLFLKNENYIMESWKRIAYGVVAKDRTAKMRFNETNGYPIISFRESNIGLFNEIRISGLVESRMGYCLEDGYITLYLR